MVPPPAISLLNAPQYLTGKVLGDEAAGYIKTRLKGKAKVVLLTHDQLQFLAPRFAAIRDLLKDIPGVTIVADISPLTVDEAGGAATMRTILLAEPDIDVVLGADTVVLGALAALRETGKARPDQFLGGIDGEPAAVAEIKSGGPYKASVSLASPIFAYAMGQHAADWLEGKSIPQAMDILPRALTLQNIARYEADVGRSRVGLQGSGASRVVSQDVRKYLLRQPGEFRQFSLVVGAEIGGRSAWKFVECGNAMAVVCRIGNGGQSWFGLSLTNATVCISITGFHIERKTTLSGQRICATITTWQAAHPRSVGAWHRVRRYRDQSALYLQDHPWHRRSFA